MAQEFTLSYTASDINRRLGLVDSLVKSVNGVMPNDEGNVEISGKISWNDLKDKPFGDGAGNLISWATAGVNPTAIPMDMWVKVSDAIVTAEDVANVTNDIEIFSWLVIDGENTYIMSNLNYGNPPGNNPFFSNADGFVLPVTDAYGNTYDGVKFTQEGVFFFTGSNYGDTTAIPLSVTVPNFGKFETFKPIDSRYLPAGLQTETIDITDKLVIESICDENGALIPLKVLAKDWMGSAYKVSSVNYPVKSCPHHESQYGEWYDIGYYEQHPWMGFCVFSAVPVTEGFYKVSITDENGNTVDYGYIATEGSGYETGLYLSEWEDTVTFTCAAGAVFEVRTPKPIDQECLPEVTTDDNGKILRVVDGAWAAVTLPIYNGEVEDV